MRASRRFPLGVQLTLRKMGYLWLLLAERCVPGRAVKRQVYRLLWGGHANLPASASESTIVRFAMALPSRGATMPATRLAFVVSS